MGMFPQGEARIKSCPVISDVSMHDAGLSLVKQYVGRPLPEAERRRRVLCKLARGRAACMKLPSPVRIGWKAGGWESGGVYEYSSLSIIKAYGVVDLPCMPANPCLPL